MEQQLRIISSSSKPKGQFLVYKFSSGFLQGNFEFSSLVSFYLENIHPFFSKRESFYSPFPCISAFHLYVLGHFLGYLSHQNPSRGHFHINATDEVGVGHWMWKWKVSPLRNFLLPTLFQLISLLLSLGF